MRRIVPVVLAVAFVAGITLSAVSPAVAYTSADCTSANTVDAGAGQTAANIQVLLSDPTVPLVCLSGDFGLGVGLTTTHTVTIFGVSGATLHYAGAIDFPLLTSAASTLTVQNLHFTGGRNPSGRGGAINGDTVSVIDSTFDDNQSDRGGAIYANLTSISGSTFTQNTATDFGGAVATGDLTIDSSTFDANQAVNSGGAIIADVVTVTNSTFVANSVTDPTAFGPTMRVSGGTVQQSTFVDNTSVSTTGGEAIWSAGFTTLNVQGDIFAGSNGFGQLAIDAGTAVPRAADLGGNLFTTSQATETYFTAAVTAVDASTHFSVDRAGMLGSAVLADNGGPVETVALPAGSSAIDAVPTTSTVTVDARGISRTAPNDAGAFEYVAPVVAPPKPSLAATGARSLWLVEPASGLIVLGLALIGAAALGRRRLREE